MGRCRRPSCIYPRKPRIKSFARSGERGILVSSSPSVRTVGRREMSELVHELAPPARSRVAHAVLHVDRAHVRASKPGPRPDPRPPREPHHMTRCRQKKTRSSHVSHRSHRCRPRTAVHRETLCQGPLSTKLNAFLMCRTSCDGRFFLPCPLLDLGSGPTRNRITASLHLYHVEPNSPQTL